MIPPTPDADVTPDDPPVWPPHAGWCFEPGRFAYRGRSYPLSRKPRELLQRFVRARGTALTLDTLICDVWEDGMVSPETVRATLKVLRRTLRQVAQDRGLERGDPLPSIRGEQAWRLELPWR